MDEKLKMLLSRIAIMEKQAREKKEEYKDKPMEEWFDGHLWAINNIKDEIERIYGMEV